MHADSGWIAQAATNVGWTGKRRIEYLLFILFKIEFAEKYPF